MTIKTNVRTGSTPGDGTVTNHNQNGVRVKSNIKSGALEFNHNQNVCKGSLT